MCVYSTEWRGNVWEYVSCMGASRSGLLFFRGAYYCTHYVIKWNSWIFVFLFFFQTSCILLTLSGSIRTPRKVNCVLQLYKGWPSDSYNRLNYKIFIFFEHDTALKMIRFSKFECSIELYKVSNRISHNCSKLNKYFILKS